MQHVFRNTNFHVNNFLYMIVLMDCHHAAEMFWSRSFHNIFLLNSPVGRPPNWTLIFAILRRCIHRRYCSHRLKHSTNSLHSNTCSSAYLSDRRHLHCLPLCLQTVNSLIIVDLAWTCAIDWNLEQNKYFRACSTTSLKQFVKHCITFSWKHFKFQHPYGLQISEVRLERILLCFCVKRCAVSAKTIQQKFSRNIFLTSEGWNL